MGAKERRQRERVETRERILDAARELFARDGYEAVTMRAIAETVEYTPTAIYHHFENKQALVTELCQLDFQTLAGHFGRVAHINDPVERVRAIGDAYLDFAQRYPNHYRFMFMTIVPEIEHSADYLAETHGNPQRDAYAFLREACARAIAAGAFRPELNDPDQLAQILWSNVHGLIALHIVKKRHNWVDFRDLKQTAKASREALMRGLLKEVPASLQAAR